MKNIQQGTFRGMHFNKQKCFTFALALSVLSCSEQAASEQGGAKSSTNRSITQVEDTSAPSMTEQVELTAQVSLNESTSSSTASNTVDQKDDLLIKVMRQFNDKCGFALQPATDAMAYTMTTAQGSFQVLADKVRMAAWKRDEVTQKVEAALEQGSLSSVANLNRTGIVLEMRWVNGRVKGFQPSQKMGMEHMQQVVMNGGKNENMSHYRELMGKRVYDQVDVRYVRTVNGALAYELVLAPGADLSKVRFTLDGIETMMVSENGGLIIKTAIGEMTMQAPVANQTKGSGKSAVSAKFVKNEDGTIGFELGEYNAQQAVIIGAIGLDWSDVGAGNTAYGLTVSPHPQAGKAIMGVQLIPKIPAKTGIYKATASDGYTNFLIQATEEGEPKNVTYFAQR